MPAALQGLRILDLTRLTPGAYATMLLADLGAEVIKVEEPGQGDYSRWTEPKLGGQGVNFLILNRNKKSITLNLKAKEGPVVLGRLVERSDVLIESFRPGVLDRLGVGYESLRALNPRLVYCALTGYGQDGPYLLYPGHDINYIGYAGILGLSRTAEGTPVVPGIEIADMGGGMAAALGTLAALAARGVTGRGQFVDISMLDVSFSLATFRLGHALATGRSPAQVAGDPTVLGYGVYETADGKYISLGAAEEKFWVNLCRLLGLEAPPQPHQLSLEERRRLNAALRRIFKSRTQAEWSALLQDKDVCYAPVLDLKEAAADPQVQERGMVFYQGTGASRLPQIGNPLRLSETPWEARTPPPGFGEHTDEVLRAVGYSEAEVQALRQKQVV